MWLKLVPDNEPNADGRWIEVPDVRYNGTSFNEQSALYVNYVPKGEHIVALSSPIPEPRPPHIAGNQAGWYPNG